MSNETEKKIAQKKEQAAKADVIKVSEDVVRKASIRAALGVDGVVRLCDRLSDNFSRVFYGKNASEVGIKVASSDEGFLIDLYIIVKFGVKIPEIAWEVQSAVKAQIKSLTNQPALAINIHVQGVED